MSLVRFYENRRRYADLVNGCLFGGDQVVSEADIKELIHYAMPIRILYEEALTYQRQLEKIKKVHREKKDLKAGAEFLGGFSKEDRVLSVVSLVIYYGKKPWDGAMDLYELLDMTEVPEEMKSLVNHYPIHILDVHRFEHTEWFQTDIREVFEFIQCANDKGKLKAFIKLRKDKLRDMDEEACDVIETITNTKELSFRDERYRNEEGGINMCKALEDWGKELEENGLQRGLQLTSAALFKFGMSAEEFAKAYDVAVETAQSWYDQWRNSITIMKTV